VHDVTRSHPITPQYKSRELQRRLCLTTKRDGSAEGRRRNLESRKKKVVGKPYEGKPHVRFEVAGAGNGLIVNTAPVLDPTNGFCLASFLLMFILSFETKPLIIALGISKYSSVAQKSDRRNHEELYFDCSNSFSGDECLH
jgi:hypothetical protein